MGQVCDRIVAYDEHMNRASLLRDLEQWEDVLVELEYAEPYSKIDGFPDAEQRQQKLLGMRAVAERRLGRFDAAIIHFRQALDITDGVERDRLGLMCELAGVYRYLGDYDAAREIYQTRHELTANILSTERLGSIDGPDLSERAKRRPQVLELEVMACEAIEDLAHANYQLSRQHNDDKLLRVAIDQLSKLIQRARKLRLEVEDISDEDSCINLTALSDTVRHLELNVYNSSTLAYAADGKTAEAVQCGEMSQAITRSIIDPTTRALSRFFHAYALLRDWQIGKAEALLGLHDPSGDMCTCAMALCKNPSAENISYLQLVVGLRIKVNHHDEQGYSALDYAVLNGSREMEDLICTSLAELNSPAQIGWLRSEALLRKHNLKGVPETSRLSTGLSAGLERSMKSHATKLRSLSNLWGIN